MIENKKLKAELLRVQAAKAEMEYQVELKRDEIQRIESHMAKQDAAEVEIKNKLTQLESK